MKLATDIISSALEVLFLYYFFSNTMEKRNYLKLTLLINLVCFVAFVMIVQFTYNSWLAPFLYLIFVFLYTSMFKENYIKKILMVLLFYALASLAEIVVGLVVCQLNGFSVEETQEQPSLYLLCVIISKLLLVFSVKLFSTAKLNGDFKIDNTTLLSTLFIEISSIISIYYFAMIAYRENNSVTLVETFLIIVVTIFANIAMFFLIERLVYLQKTKDTLENMEQQYKIQTEYYSELKENLLQTNKNTHDIRNFIASISSYINSEENDLAKAKIEDFCGKIPNYDDIDTGNAAVNALVRSKIDDINDNITNKYISVLVPDKMKIDEIDLCILIGNGLDNAIEACKKIKEKEKRRLTIKVFPFNNQLSICIENSFYENQQEKSSIFDNFKTSKKNKFKHGFGIKNMENIVQKYNGSIVFKKEENNFSVSVLIPDFTE